MPALQLARLPWMVMVLPAAALVPARVPGVYGLVTPLTVMVKSSVQPTPPAPGLKVAVTPRPKQTVPPAGTRVASVGAVTRAATVKEAVWFWVMLLVHPVGEPEERDTICTLVVPMPVSTPVLKLATPLEDVTLVAVTLEEVLAPERL